MPCVVGVSTNLGDLNVLSKYLFRHETILVLLAHHCARGVSAQLSDRFFTVENLLNQGRMLTEVGIISLGMTFVIITGRH